VRFTDQAGYLVSFGRYSKIDERSWMRREAWTEALALVPLTQTQPKL
jgi:hypothetical protein